MASTTEKTLKARIQLVDNFTKPVKKALGEAKKFEKTVKNMKATIKVKDMATKTIKKVTELAKKFAKGSYQAMVKVKDGASSVLGKLKSTMGSLAAGVTIGVAVKSIAGGAMDLEQYQTSIRHFMGVGNKGKSEAELNAMSGDYNKWLTNNANYTPFSTNEVMAGGTKALTAKGGNVAQAQKLIQRAEDMAGLTGKSLDQAVDALVDAEMGQYARMMEFGVNPESGEDPAKVMALIDERFAGGADKLSKTAKGKFSTSIGTLQSSLANFGTSFLPLMSTAFDGVTNLLNGVSPKMMEFGSKVASSLEKFSKSKEAGVLLDNFKTVAIAVFDMVKNVIEKCRPFIEQVFNFLLKNSPTITLLIETLGSIWNAFWSTAGPLLQVAWAIIEPALQDLFDLVDALLTAIKGIFNWWGKMADKINANPIVEGIKGVGEALKNANSNGNNGTGGIGRAFGLTRVARDGDVYKLHQGEKVLTKAQANAYEKGANGGVSISIGSMVVREEADITKIANKLYQKIKEASNVAVVGV